MGWNLPNDWNAYGRTCDNGHPYHASEGACDECNTCPHCQHLIEDLKEDDLCENCLADGVGWCVECFDLRGELDEDNLCEWCRPDEEDDEDDEL